MDKIRVLVADDHPAFREGLCWFLAEEPDMEIVARAEDGEQALHLAMELQPEVVIIDVAMPKVNGIQAAQQIKTALPETSILMLSAFDYESYLLASVRAGAAGYMLKSTPVADLVNAVRMVNRGEALFDYKSISKILDQIVIGDGTINKVSSELHRRELDVLKLAAKGMSNKEIAESLWISERTVQTHMFNIFKKFRVSSRIEAVLHGLHEGWFTLDDIPQREET